MFVGGIVGFSNIGDDFGESGEDARLLMDGFEVIAGEAGRLMKEFMIGVMGVLEGRGPGSIDNDGNGLRAENIDESTPFGRFGWGTENR